MPSASACRPQSALELLQQLERTIGQLLNDSRREEPVRQKIAAAGLAPEELVHAVATACSLATAGLQAEVLEPADLQAATSEPGQPDQPRGTTLAALPLVHAALRLLPLAADALLYTMVDEDAAGVAAAGGAPTPGSSLGGSEPWAFATALLRWMQACGAAGAAAARVASLGLGDEGSRALLLANLRAAEAVVRLGHIVPAPQALPRALGYPADQWVPPDLDGVTTALAALLDPTYWGFLGPTLSELADPLRLVSSSVCRLAHAATTLQPTLQPHAFLRAAFCLWPVAKVALKFWFTAQLMDLDCLLSTGDASPALELTMWEMCSAARCLFTASGLHASTAAAESDELRAFAGRAALALMEVLLHVPGCCPPLFRALGGSSLLVQLIDALPHGVGPKSSYFATPHTGWEPLEFLQILRSLARAVCLPGTWWWCGQPGGSCDFPCCQPVPAIAKGFGTGCTGLCSGRPRLPRPAGGAAGRPPGPGLVLPGRR